MGHFRFSDIDRNLLVASTNMPDMSKDSLLDSLSATRIRRHYSELKGATDVFGTEGVYSNGHATGQQIRFKYSRPS